MWACVAGIIPGREYKFGIKNIQYNIHILGYQLVFRSISFRDLACIILLLGYILKIFYQYSYLDGTKYSITYKFIYIELQTQQYNGDRETITASQDSISDISMFTIMHANI